MVSFKHTPRSWREAHAVPRRGRDQLLKLGYETHLERRATMGKEAVYVIRHHDTDIVTFHEGGSLILNAAIVSYTTASRMDTFTPGGVSVVARGVSGDEPHYVVKTLVGTRLLFKGDTTVIKESDINPPLPQRFNKRGLANGQTR